MKNLIFSLSLVLFLAFGLLLSLGQPSVVQAKSSKGKITICHATGSEKNPFVEINISKNGWENGHNGRHQDGKDFVVVGENCPTKKVEPPEETSEKITPQIAGASISPEVAEAKSLPQGGGNSSLVTSLIISIGLICASALIHEGTKKLHLA